MHAHIKLLLNRNIRSYVAWALFILIGSSWGFAEHKCINRLAVFTLPAKMNTFYKDHIGYIEEHAVDADKRRYVDADEGAKHYIDVDHFGPSPFEKLPERWDDAVARYSKDTLKAYGILPWQIQHAYYQLIKAFQAKNTSMILKVSADLGHYIADAHVPLHTTGNYDGQLTGQEGIHALWETRLPELFSDQYDFLVGRAQYIKDPLKEAWTMVKHSFAFKNTVLTTEKKLRTTFPPSHMFTFENRNGKLEKVFSKEYALAYHKALHGMVEKQMRASIHSIGSFWYSAWVDAGQPDLSR